MTVAIYPDDLKPASWDKKKGSLPPQSELPDKLQALLKKHGGVKWSQFEDGWAAGASTHAALDEAFAERDRLFRVGVFPLKKDAQEIAGLAQRLSKDKASTELMVTAGKAIAAAANTFTDAVDDGVDALKTAYEKAKRQLPEADEGDNEPPALLLDPRKLAAQLTLCRRDVARKVQFAYVDGKDKQPAVLAMHPRTASRMLFTKVSDATGVKTGAHGTAWVDETVLYLQMEKPLSGLAKKVRAPLKGCGFKVAKIVLWDEKGQQTEADDEPDAPPQGESGTSTSGSQPSSGPSSGPSSEPKTDTPQAQSQPPTPDELARPAFTLLLQTLETRYAKALQSAPEAVRKLEPLLEFGRKQGASGGYATGLTGLKKFGELLLAALGKEEAEWEILREQSDAKLLAAMRQIPTAAGKLRALLELADKRASERKFDLAVQALQQLDKLVATIGLQRESESKQLRLEFARWQKDPADIDDSTHRGLQALRGDITAALEGDVELARLLIEMLAVEWGQAEKAAQELKKELLAALEQGLREVVDPQGLELLAKNPLLDARQAVRAALDRGAVAEATDALEQLRRAVEEAETAIADETQRRLGAFQDDLEKLLDPPGCEDGELQVLGPLRTAAQELILGGTLAPIPAALKALADAIGKAVTAIEERLVQKLQALQLAFDKVVLPPGATTPELAPAEGARLRVVEALKDRLPGPGQQALREYVLALRKVAREVARRLKAERGPEEVVEDPAVQQGRARAQQLRGWIETNVYTPNATIKTDTGELLGTPDADDAFDVETIEQDAYEVLLKRLTEGDKKRIDDTQARILLLAEPRKQLQTRTRLLASALERCALLKVLAAPKTPSGWVVPDMKKLAHIPAGQHELALRGAANDVANALAGLSFDILKDDGVAQAQLVLLSSSSTLTLFNEWRKRLAHDDTSDGPTALLECARLAVDNGLRFSKAQSRYNGAKGNKMPLAVLKAQLDADYEEQALIKAEDQLKVLGQSARYAAQPAYSGLALHLSLYDGVYKGDQRWPKGTTQDPNDATRQNKILDALVGSQRGGIHVTLEWTGERDYESNLKCYRSAGGAGTAVMWNGAQAAYVNCAAGRTAANGAQANGFRKAPDIGATYPTENAAKTHLANTLNAILTTMRNRIIEMCANRGMTAAEKNENKRDKVLDK